MFFRRIIIAVTILFAICIMPQCNGTDDSDANQDISKPDLADGGSYLEQLTPNPVGSSNSFQALCMIENNSDINTGSYYIDLYASVDQNFDKTNDYFIASHLVSSTQAWANNVITVNVQNFPLIPSGSYYIIYVIDSMNQISEDNENNNIGICSNDVLQIDNDSNITIDLYDDGESSRSFSPTTINAGEDLSISTDIRNGGTGSSVSFTVKFYASIDTSINTSDYLIGSKSMSSITAGSYENCDWSGVFPSTIPVGTYYVGWIIDSENTISESNESNNTAYKTGYQLNVPPPVTQPDLYDRGESYCSFTPTSIVQGSGTTLNILTDISNEGTGSSGSFTVKFYASTDTSINTSDYLIGSKSMSSITAGSYENCDWSGAFPSTIPAGTYYVGWIIDSESTVSESNENNNTAYKTGYQLNVPPPVTQPDLYDRGESYRSFTPQAITHGSGTTFSISCDIVNGGANASGSFTVAFYASTDTAINANDDHLIGTKSMSSIAAGSYADCNWSSTLSSGIPAGTYYVGWIIDSEKIISETNENNNTAYKTGYQLTVVASVDLYDRGESYCYFTPTSIIEGSGSTLNIFCDIRNGGTDASGSFIVKFYASTDTSINASDNYIGSTSMTSIAAGSWANCDWSGAFPATITDGTYYIGWIIDSENTIPETVETNNTGYKAGYQLTVPPSIDLYDRGESYRSFSPTSIVQGSGSTISISCDIRNGGLSASGSFTVKFYASRDTSINASDNYIGSTSMSSIAAGASANCDWSGAFPSTIPAGTYYVGWIIDSESTVSESNENNNTAYKTGYQLIVPVAVNTGTLNDYNPYDIPIEDNGAVATSDLYLSGAPSGSIITKITLYFEIIHTYPGDLDIWLTYYDGGWHDYYIYHYNDLGSDDNVIYSGVINFYNGISPNQTWYLSVQDRMIGDSGYINYFELWIDYEY